MKKHNILKVTGLSFLVLALLTWIIPAGTYSGTEYVKGEISPTGLFDLFYSPIMMVGVVIQYVIILLVIGGFYGVLSKTGVYTKLVNSVVEKFNKKENKFLILSICLFAVLTSVVGYPFVLFLLVPFAAAVITLLGYNKVTSMLATVGAMMVGVVGSTTSADVAGLLSQTYGTSINDNLLIKFVILVVVTVLYAMTVVKMSKVVKVIKEEVKEEKVSKKTTTKKVEAKKTTAKKTTAKKATTKAETTGKKDVVKVKKETKKEAVKEVKKETKKEIKNVLLYNAKDINKDKSVLPLLVIAIVMIIVMILSTFNWSLFEITFFTELNTKILDVKLFDRAIVEYLIGYVAPFGQWTVNNIIALILISIPLIGWIYSVKLDDVIDGFISGVKTMIKPAVSVLLASLMFSVFISISEYGLSLAQNNIFFTAMNALLGLTDGFNSIVIAVITFIGGVMISDFSILNSFISVPVAGLYEPETFKIFTLVVQSVYGLTLFVAPSSMLLLAGLSLFDINYKEWLKTISKLLVKIVLLILIVLVVTLFI